VTTARGRLFFFRFTRKTTFKRPTGFTFDAVREVPSRLRARRRETISARPENGTTPSDSYRVCATAFVGRRRLQTNLKTVGTYEARSNDVVRDPGSRQTHDDNPRGHRRPARPQTRFRSNATTTTTGRPPLRPVRCMRLRTFRCRGYYTRSDRRPGGPPIHRCFPHLWSGARWPPSPGRPPVGTARRNRWSPYSPDGTSPSRTEVLRICTTRQTDRQKR